MCKLHSGSVGNLETRWETGLCCGLEKADVKDENMIAKAEHGRVFCTKYHADAMEEMIV